MVFSRDLLHLNETLVKKLLLPVFFRDIGMRVCMAFVRIVTSLVWHYQVSLENYRLKPKHENTYGTVFVCGHT